MKSHRSVFFCVLTVTGRIGIYPFTILLHGHILYPHPGILHQTSLLEYFRSPTLLHFEAHKQGGTYSSIIHDILEGINLL